MISANAKRVKHLFTITTFLFLVVNSPRAHAQKIVTIFMDGAWCQKTTGQGTDNVSVAAAVDKIPQSGDWDPANIKTYTYNVGTYNDHGGPGNQEMRKLNLARFVLQPGDSAEVVVAMYGDSNGGFFAHIGGVFKALGPDIAGVVAAVYGSPALGAAVKVGSDKVVGAVSKAFKSADSGNYVGDAKIQVFNDDKNKITYTIAPNTNASDMGINPAGSRSIALNGPRAQYWIKLAVK